MSSSSCNKGKKDHVFALLRSRKTKKEKERVSREMKLGEIESFIHHKFVKDKPVCLNLYGNPTACTCMISVWHEGWGSNLAEFLHDHCFSSRVQRKTVEIHYIQNHVNSVTSSGPKVFPLPIIGRPGGGTSTSGSVPNVCHWTLFRLLDIGRDKIATQRRHMKNGNLSVMPHGLAGRVSNHALKKPDSKAKAHLEQSVAQQKYFNFLLDQAKLTPQPDTTSRHCHIVLVISYFSIEQPPGGGATYYFSPLDHHVFALGIYNAKEQHIYMYTHERSKQSEKGGNEVASVIYDYLSRCDHLNPPEDGGFPLHRLSIVFLDNFIGQIKNNMVLRMASYLVECKYFQQVEFVFLVAGHATNNEQRDRMFNLLYINHTTVVTDWYFRDWDQYLDRLYTRLPSNVVDNGNLFMVDMGFHSGQLMFVCNSTIPRSSWWDDVDGVQEEENRSLADKLLLWHKSFWNNVITKDILIQAFSKIPKPSDMDEDDDTSGVSGDTECTNEDIPPSPMGYYIARTNGLSPSQRKQVLTEELPNLNTIIQE